MFAFEFGDSKGFRVCFSWKETRRGGTAIFLVCSSGFFAEREERNFNDGSGKKEENMRDLEGRIFLSSKRGENVPNTRRQTMLQSGPSYRVCLSVWEKEGGGGASVNFPFFPVSRRKRWRTIKDGGKF